MITVEPIADEAYIKSVFLNPTIYSQMKDDSCPDDPSLLMGAEIMKIPGFFLCAIVDGVRVGIWWLVWRNDKVEAHTALLPECRGRAAITATRAAIRWVFQNTPATAIRSYAWSDSPAVKWFCRAVGMSEKETESWPSKRAGAAVDVTYYEISREET